MKCKFCKKKIEEKDLKIVGIYKIHKFCFDDFIKDILKKVEEKRKSEINKIDEKFKKLKVENKKSGAKQGCWKWFSLFIRERDKKENCISCKKSRSSYHCGHYIPKSKGEQFYFNEENCNKQCSYCNLFLSGNLAKYRTNLIKKIGLEKVEELEKLKPITDNRDTEFYKKLAKFYKKKYEDLKNFTF